MKVLILCFLPLTTWAAEWKGSWEGEAKANAYYYAEKVGPDTKQFQGLYQIKLGANARYGRAWRMQTKLQALAAPDSPSRVEEFWADASEAFLQYQKLPFSAQLGLNTFTWGDTDVVNPLDVLNARRYYDPLRSEKLGAPSLALRYDFGALSSDLVYIPWQRKTQIPGENSRWLPRDIYRSRSIGTNLGVGRIELPSTIRYRYLSEQELNHALENNIGLRLKGRLSGFDFQLVGFEGAASAPQVSIKQITATATSVAPDLSTINFRVNPDIGLEPVYYRVRVAGVSFVWVLGDFLVKGASAYTKPVSKRNDLPKKAFENVLGVEHNLSFLEGVTLLVQGAYADHGDALDTNSTSLSRMFDEAGMLGLRWAPNEKFNLLLSALGDFKFGGALVHGESNYSLSDHWKLAVSADVLGGKKETPLGTYKRNDRAVLSLSALW